MKVRMTGEEIAAKDKEIAHEVAARLSKLGEGQWAAFEDTRFHRPWRIQGPDGMKLDVHVLPHNNFPERVVAGGELERNPPVHGAILYAEGNPEITVAMERGYDVLAAEIVRRVLPGYKKVFLENRKRIAEANQYAAKVEANNLRLAVAFGAQNPKPGTEQFWAGSHRIHAGGNSVTLELRSISVEQAVQIGELLRTPAKLKANLTVPEPAKAGRE